MSLRSRLALVVPILELVAGQYQVSVAQLMSHDRHASVCKARRRVWLIVRDTFDWSLPEIAFVFRRDHTTILSGIRKARDELERELFP